MLQQLDLFPPTLLGLLGRTNLNHWTLALSKGPNSIGIQSPNYCVLQFIEYRTMLTNPIIVSVTKRCQNPLESTSKSSLGGNRNVMIQSAYTNTNEVQTNEIRSHRTNTT
jgi:hypothetical protein